MLALLPSPQYSTTSPITIDLECILIDRADRADSADAKLSSCSAATNFAPAGRGSCKHGFSKCACNAVTCATACALLDQGPFVGPFAGQRDRPFLDNFMFPLMHEAGDQKLEFLKLPWNVQHEMVFGQPDAMTICCQICSIVYGNRIG